jgi:hypothetical protein
MGSHIVDGEFQSDKYPTCPRGKVPLSVKDPTAQDLLWAYAQRRRKVDAEFSADLEAALATAGFITRPNGVWNELDMLREEIRILRSALQVAESVRDAARAASNRDIERRRMAEAWLGALPPKGP